MQEEIFERSKQRPALHMPISWGSECRLYLQGAYKIIDMMHAEVTMEDAAA
jgi:hypothetical protein